MAPEILEGAPASVRSDVYSLGVLLAHLVTRAFPVEARSLAELRERHRKGEARLLREMRPDLPGGFVQVVERALATDPADRFSSAGRMEHALEAALGAGGGAGEGQGSPAVSIPRWVYAAAGLAAIVVVLTVVAPRLWWRSGDGTSTSGPAVDSAGPASGAPLQDPHARVASLHDLAGLYEAMGAYGRAAEIYGQALALEEQALGPDDPLLGDSLTRLAWLHHVSGNEPEARVYYERATLVLDRRRVSPDAGADAAFLDLGVLLGEAGRLDDARKFLESALEHRERAFGPDHPEVKAALDALAKLYVDAGDYVAAKPLLERSAAIAERSGDNSESSSLASLESLGKRPGGPGLYDVEAALYRSGGPRGKERLAADSRVVPDDRLFLEFRASIPLYVYVVNEDDRGDASLLFPLPGFDLVNPLPPNAVHRLPGRLLAGNQRISWQVSSAGEREHFLVVASPERLLEFEEEIANLIVPRLDDEPLVAAQLSAATTTRLRGIHRGIAQLAVEPEEEPAVASVQTDGVPVRLFQLARPLGAGPETVRGVWIRRLDLENPG
jgi:tetratricopeptide (TPR) repeat protein